MRNHLKSYETNELALSVSEVIASEKAEAEAMAIWEAKKIEESEYAFLDWLEDQEDWEACDRVWKNIKARQEEVLQQ